VSLAYAHRLQSLGRPIIGEVLLPVEVYVFTGHPDRYSIVISDLLPPWSGFLFLSSISQTDIVETSDTTHREVSGQPNTETMFE
jgi:hypothetical protein